MDEYVNIFVNNVVLIRKWRQHTVTNLLKRNRGRKTKSNVGEKLMRVMAYTAVYPVCVIVYANVVGQITSQQAFKDVH